MGSTNHTRVFSVFAEALCARPISERLPFIVSRLIQLVIVVGVVLVRVNILLRSG